MIKLQLLMMFVRIKKSFVQAINEHITYKKITFHFAKSDLFSKRLLKSQNICYEKQKLSKEN